MLIQLLLGLIVALLTSCFDASEQSVEEILDNIESTEVVSLTANVVYTRTDPILDRREIRTGRVLFRKVDGGKREAAILFDTLIIGRRKEEKQKHYIFSGRWMAEVDHEKKQFIKRELVSPDEESVDPFELGNGPIPLPIGQSKVSVLKQFAVELISRPSEGPLSKLDENVIGLHLVPKAKDEWEFVDLFYDPDTWLPVGVRTVELDGTKRVSRLTNMQKDVLSVEDSQLLNIETPDPKEWTIDIQFLRVD